MKVFPSLVKRRKTHFHILACGASIILGNNGFIWISATVNDREQNGLGGFTENLKEVSNDWVSALACPVLETHVSFRVIKNDDITNKLHRSCRSQLYFLTIQHVMT